MNRHWQLLARTVGLSATASRAKIARTVVLERECLIRDREELHRREQCRPPAHWIVERDQLRQSLKRANRDYGRASATIGALRAQVAQLREQVRDLSDHQDLYRVVEDPWMNTLQPSERYL